MCMKWRRELTYLRIRRIRPNPIIRIPLHPLPPYRTHIKLCIKLLKRFFPLLTLDAAGFAATRAGAGAAARAVAAVVTAVGWGMCGGEIRGAEGIVEREVIDGNVGGVRGGVVGVRVFPL